jgi:hypothetical protein
MLFLFLTPSIISPCSLPPTTSGIVDDGQNDPRGSEVYSTSPDWRGGQFENDIFSLGSEPQGVRFWESGTKHHRSITKIWGGLSSQLQ